MRDVRKLHVYGRASTIDARRTPIREEDRALYNANAQRIREGASRMAEYHKTSALTAGWHAANAEISRLENEVQRLTDELRQERDRADSVQFALDGARSVAKRDNEFLIARAEKAEAELARIAARRDDASDAVQRARAATYLDEPTSTAIVDAVFAALGVDR